MMNGHTNAVHLFGNKNAWPPVTGETKVQQIEVPTKICSNHAHGEDTDVTIDSARQTLDAVHRAQILILQFPVHRSAAAPTNPFIIIIIIFMLFCLQKMKIYSN